MIRGCMAALLASIGLTAGCMNPGPVNPTFPLTVEQAKAALHSMRLNPKPLVRPVVVLQGYLDPGISTTYMRSQLRSVVKAGIILDVTFLDCSDFDQCRRKVIDLVRDDLPGGSERYTAEVDAIGVSMGGLVARYAARPVTGSTRQMRLARLFTIATPNRGAKSDLLPVGRSRMPCGPARHFFIGSIRRRLPLDMTLSRMYGCMMRSSVPPMPRRPA